MSKPVQVQVQVRARGNEVVAAPELQPIALRSMFWRPALLQASDAMEHVPFGFWLVEAHRPKMIVELGVGLGTSYFAFCQAVERLGLDARCFGVDAWPNDAAPGEPSSFERASAYNQAHYSGFSRLLRGSFDASRRHFAAGSIDLLHIDGAHTLEAVTGDFESWAPKLSDRAIVLLHATNMREEGHGVHQLFERLKSRFPSFEFVHGQGMGVLGVGPEQNGMVRQLFAAAGDDDAQWSIRDVFARLGRGCRDAFEAEREQGRALVLARTAEDDARRLAQLAAAVEQAQRDLEARTADLERTREKLDLQVERHAMERGQLSERITLMQEMQAELKAQLAQARVHADQAEQRARETTKIPEGLLASLQQRLDATLESARRQAGESGAQAQALASAQRAHGEELAARDARHAQALATAQQAHHGELAARDARHAQALATAQQAHDEALAARDARHAQALAAVQRAHGEELAAREADRAEALAALAREHAAALQAREAGHAQALAALQREHAGAVAALEQRAATTLQARDAQHAREFAAREAATAEAMQALRDELAALQPAADEARAAADEARAVARQAQAEAGEAAALADSAQRAERSGAERHAATVARLQAELAAANQRAIQAETASRADRDAVALDRAKAATSVQVRFRETAQLTRRVLALQDEAAAEAAERARLQGEAAAGAAERARLQDEATAGAAERERLQRLLQASRTERLAVETQLALARREAEASRQSGAALRASRSWRMTRPMRAIRGGEPAMPDGRPDPAELLRASPLFDAGWYVDSYADVAEAGADPVLHFLEHGAAEGRDPGLDFSVADYLRANPDVAEAGANPLLHFLEFGLAEGRRLHPEA